MSKPDAREAGSNRLFNSMPNGSKWKSLPRKNTDAEYTEGDAMTIPARYEKGVFRPLQDVPIKEGTVVEVLLPSEPPAMKPASIADSPFAGMWKDREDM